MSLIFVKFHTKYTKQRYAYILTHPYILFGHPQGLVAIFLFSSFFFHIDIC